MAISCLLCLGGTFCWTAPECRAAPSAAQLRSAAEAHDAMGKACERQGHLPEAAAEYQEAVSLQPHWTDAYLDLAWALKAEGRFPAGERVMREAVRVNPSSSDCWYGLGDMLLEQRRYAESLAPYRQSVRLNPSQWMGDRRLNAVCARLGRWPEAIRAGLAWSRLLPASAEAHDALSYAYESSGNDTAGAAHSRLALKLDPDDVLAHDNLGCALARQGHRAQAHALWQWVLAHDRGPTAADARQMLAKYP